MIMDPLFILAFALLGAFGGFAAGLLGIGGGMVLVPFLNTMLPMLGVPELTAVHAAIATAMATIIFTSLSSMRAHHAHGAIRWDVARLMIPGLLIGGLLSGGAIFSVINGFYLAIIFVAFVGYSAIKMLSKKPVAVEKTLPKPWAITAFGGVIGFVSGLLGAGGGFLSVPFLARCNVPMPKAIATSAALGFFIAVSNGVGYIWSGLEQTKGEPGMIGYVYWPALLIISIMSILTAPYGARMAHRLPIPTLRRIFAVVLLLLAAQMIVKTIRVYYGI